MSLNQLNNIKALTGYGMLEMFIFLLILMSYGQIKEVIPEIQTEIERLEK
jgi:hypothetical protein